MNWLAHVYLSPASVHYRLGNLLADAMKGRAWVGAPAETLAGMERHREIDRFTDGHPVFLRSRDRLGERGYLRGIVVDLVYDHCLSKNWRQFCGQDLQPFLDQFYEEALAAVEQYPVDARRFVRAIVESGRLGSYASLAGIESAMRRMDQRLSPRLLRRETTLGLLPAVERELAFLEEDFMEFFPQLQARVRGID